jgi:four helix bundle protein
MSIYNLEERTTEFAKRIIRLCGELSKNEINKPLISQIIRSAGSVGANYREANDALGDRDFLHKIRISRKECKESLHWLELIEEANPKLKPRMQNLKNEAREIKNILSSIILKKENKKITKNVI